MVKLAKPFVLFTIDLWHSECHDILYIAKPQLSARMMKISGRFVESIRERVDPFTVQGHFRTSQELLIGFARDIHDGVLDQVVR